MTPEPWATAQAEWLIAPLGDRWLHVQAVADKARGVAAVLSAEDADLLVAAALVQTWATLPRCIGSAFMAVDGARFLRGQGQERLARLVRTPQVDHQVAAIIRATVGLCADPAELLAQQARGLRLVPEPGDAA
jgi:hypothetical protein